MGKEKEPINTVNFGLNNGRIIGLRAIRKSKRKLKNSSIYGMMGLRVSGERRERRIRMGPIRVRGGRS